MIESPLTIIKHHPGKIRIIPAEGDTEFSKACSIRTKYNSARHATEKRNYRIELLVEFGKVKKGTLAERYRGEVEMVGYFEVHEDYPEEHVEDLIGVTGVSVLYGAARELICQFTARHPHGCLSIPSVSFIDEAS
jgi:preprotein translocase subunit SecB